MLPKHATAFSKSLHFQIPVSPNRNVIFCNIFIGNNIISNRYITYICEVITVEDYGEQAFYIRRCDLGR